ncbi:hypothetical protein [Agromyces sp. NPDC058104]|uniref:hypothetical protein n=1 Tax=Agromyces sp. NPDC058104 TaxID=3346342 RepID=UPI0036DB858F
MVIPDELQGKVTTDVATTARLLEIGLNQAYAAVKKGTIPSIRIGGRYVVPVAPLLKMLGLDSEPEA